LCASGSLGALLVLPILFPQPFTQLGIRFLHRSLAQLTRNDVVVPAIRYVGWHRVRAGATKRTAAADTTSAALLAVDTARRLSASSGHTTRPLAFVRLQAGIALAARPAGRITFVASSGLTCYVAGTLAGSRASPGALLGDRFLLPAHAFVEDRKGFVEATVDLGATVLGGGRSAASSAAARRLAARAA
jgi:hypothetical protein